ncbi:aspartyl/glutamyl-tRNA(Asn/Gln) amidotransferase subunit C [Clostridia bacterium]|nr:aspartyl/glutamyl-tRNA(Asn/Gln) amidotransferase subunit C [Clostridia bacterium]
MPISKQEILHLADLSNLSLSEAEIESLGPDLDNIITYISQLDELNTEGIKPTYQVSEMQNVTRPDEITEFEADRKSLLSLTKDQEDNQIKVPKVL